MPKGKEREMLIDPALQGTTTLLSGLFPLPSLIQMMIQPAREPCIGLAYRSWQLILPCDCQSCR